MTRYRWLGAVALAGSLGCSDSFSNAPDGSAGGPDGPTVSEAASASDASSDAVSSDAGCVTGSVTFEVQRAPGTTGAYCLGAPGTCSAQWLDLRPEGNDASILTDKPCEAQCGDCQPVGCPAICPVPSRLGDGGAQTTWDGTYYTSGACGAGMLACISPACAPAGKYIATFCGYPESSGASGLGCAGSSTPTCTETPFLWPPPAGSPPVQGFLGGAPADGGSCCPAGWGLSSCTYPDGGAGKQCHNPALGCASSTTCGQGCDAVVTGACEGG